MPKRVTEIAPCLLTLRTQLDGLFPGRSRRSDGFIASPQHTAQNPDSDHEPRYGRAGVWYCTAGDFTNDPANGLDCGRLADALWRGRDPRVKYVIWNGQIMAGRHGPKPWVWRKYSGPNPHVKHLHLSVLSEPISLGRMPWDLTGLAKENEVSVSNSEQVWAHPVLDRYREGTMRAVDALEWSAFHGANNRDLIDEVLRDVEGLQKEMDEQRTLMEAIALKVGVTPP